MIIPVYKPFGVSTHLLAQKVGALYGEKATHTGTLDPAAEGVVVVLTGEDRFQKEKLAGTTKIYEATILLGISTDTHDMVGLPCETRETAEMTRETCISRMNDLVGTYEQEMPVFSAKRINGQSYFDLARTGTEFKPVRQVIHIHEIALHSVSAVLIQELEKYFDSKIDKIQGDFRQREIKNHWKAVITGLEAKGIKKLQAIDIKVICSKRTYIRALVRDFSESTGMPAVLYSLTRTHNGSYSIKDCICLIPPSVSMARNHKL